MLTPQGPASAMETHRASATTSPLVLLESLAVGVICAAHKENLAFNTIANSRCLWLDLKIYRKSRVGNLSGGCQRLQGTTELCLWEAGSHQMISTSCLRYSLQVGSQTWYHPPLPKPLRFLTLWATTRNFLALGIDAERLGEAEGLIRNIL